MPYTVEAFKKAKGDTDARWHVEGTREDREAAEAYYHAVCSKRAGAVILRGTDGELLAKRSVVPA